MTTSIQKKINQKLATLEKKGIYIFISQPENYQLTNEEIMSYLIKKLKFSGTYIALNKSNEEISKSLEKRKISTKDILFIDGVAKKCNSKNCISLSENKSLTELSLTITQVCKEKSIKFVFLDSLSTLSMFNNIAILERFMQYLINKIKNLGILLIIIAVEDEQSNKLTPFLSQFSDGYIKI